MRPKLGYNDFLEKCPKSTLSTEHIIKEEKKIQYLLTIRETLSHELYTNLEVELNSAEQHLLKIEQEPPSASGSSPSDSSLRNSW